MPLQLFKKPKQLSFERSYHTPLTTVWRAWTEGDEAATTIEHTNDISSHDKEP